MKITSNIYLTKKYVEASSWEELIKIISEYNGFFKTCSIVIKNTNNKISYYINSNCNFPTTINNLNSFMFKNTEDVIVPKISKSIPIIPKSNSNLFDLIDYFSIKNKGDLEFVTIFIKRINSQKIIDKIYLYVNKNNKIKKYRAYLTDPTKILSCDFEGNKRFSCLSIPKYLDISKMTHLLNTDATISLLKVDTFPYLEGNFYLKQASFSFDKHSIIFGSSGCGKSKFISSIISNINKNNNLKTNYKVVVIDPHASLENEIGGFGRVIDFSDNFNSINLFCNTSNDIISSTELLMELLKSLIEDQYNSKLERILRHSIHLLLTNKCFNFSNLRKLILDLEYRNSLIKNSKLSIPMSTIEFFLSDFSDLKTKYYGEAISPIIGFIDEMEMLPAFNNQESTDYLSQVIKDNFLSLFSLNRTKLGDKITKAISGLIMQQLLTLIQTNEIPEHIIFVVDEVAVVESPILCRFLSESRKYNLSLFLAGQYFNQISKELQNSIFANVINYYIFRISKLDAITIADNFNIKIPLKDDIEEKRKLLTELNNRECIVRLSSNDVLLPAFKARTLDFESIPRIKKEIKIDKINEIEEENVRKTKFTINTNVNLKDILINNTNREE